MWQRRRPSFRVPVDTRAPLKKFLEPRPPCPVVGATPSDHPAGAIAAAHFAGSPRALGVLLPLTGARLPAGLSFAPATFDEIFLRALRSAGGTPWSVRGTP